MNIAKVEETDKTESKGIYKSNEYFKMNTKQMNESLTKSKEKFTVTNFNEILGYPINPINNSINSSMNYAFNSKSFFSLPDESPGRLNIANNFTISPLLDNKFKNVFNTPNNMTSEGGNGATPNLQMEINIDSPDHVNIIQGLKHDEKLSSFKRININDSHNEIKGRNINFEGEVLENIHQKESGINNIINNSNLSIYNIHKSHNQNLNNLHNYKRINYLGNLNPYTNDITNKRIIANQRGFLIKNKINLSSESDSQINNSEEEDRDLRKNQRNAKNPTMSINMRPEKNRKYTLQMSNNISITTDKQESTNNKINLCCRCTRSRCLKKYCECYANNEYCYGCECHNCYNLPKFKELIKRSLESENQENKINYNEKVQKEEDNDEILCKCTKSNCRKKYCECFKAGEGCKEQCRCINCENEKKAAIHPQSNFITGLSYNFSKININLTDDKRKAARNPQNYILEGTSVFICNQDITVSFRKEILNKNKEKEIIINENRSKEDQRDNKLNNLDSGKIHNQPFKSNRKNSKMTDINPESIFSSNDNESKFYEYPEKEKNSNSADKYITRYSNLETPNINRKRKRITTNDSITKSSSTLFHTPLFATTTSAHKINKKKVNLDQEIIKKLDKIY